MPIKMKDEVEKIGVAHPLRQRYLGQLIHIVLSILL